MNTKLSAGLLAAGVLLAPGIAAASTPSCGANTGEAATGAPILIGGIHGNAAPGDFSSATDAAAAYFSCVNANGGVHGRPIEYMVENDQWNPELAARAAAKLVTDAGVVAMVGNSSFVEMSVNAPLYASSNTMAMAAGCAASECFESSNIVSTNQGPLPSSVGAAMYAVEELGATSVACIGLAIPSVGNWSCGAVEEYMASKGLSGASVLMNPAAPDVNSALLEAIASGADSMLVNLPVGLGIAYFGVAQEQDLGDVYSWTSSTPIYDASVPGALGDYWHGKVYVSAELTQIDGDGPDNLNWQAVMDAYASEDDPRDIFSQSGYLAAKFFVETLMDMDPAQLDDRAAVTDAIKAINGKTSDLVCGPYYVGEADRHMPNHAGIIVVVKDGGFEKVRDCFEYEGACFDGLIEAEKALGLR
ncbi:ABC transporter substrate-binding protein [Tropicibacter naphthalenivorans]|uniref:Urea ABC transporter, urea binding protein n=1 Tax=Tropicibacter naphthalenivorans TaxID=441103 RepID=A0A0N7M148_9RHOB|nr:ABC transporter substrate-binding protein [Tropicibacter naphthalenivorans]CUH82265.1 urea ABC transporter, urea binding protein [Tropicibacter naphthalenivorans]SMD04678.1 amino acid/amide ABC transporter substrate-binding protein, HAAT family [Tropicibacter naphthalenivorans]